MARQYLSARFSPDGMPYTYHNDGPPVRPGDRVNVAGRGGKGTPRTVEVVEASIPKPLFETKPIIGLTPDTPEGLLL